MKATKQKRKVEEIMKEYNSLLVSGITRFNEAIVNLCNNKPAEFDKALEAIIQIEKHADRLKDELIEKFIKRETMAFSRGDRIQLIERIDIVLDKIEYCARMIQAHMKLIKNYGAVAEEFKKYTKDLVEVVKTLSSAIDATEEDLQKAIEGTRLVEELRRHARAHSFQIMALIMEQELPDIVKMLLYTEMEYMLSILDEAEESSDFLRMIAIKYLVLE
ncbi:MAG: DUF47 domain-containing protein [Candidatus Helarchaeota archaeon]